MKRITVSLDHETYNLLKSRAAELDVSLSALVRMRLSGLARDLLRLARCRRPNLSEHARLNRACSHTGRDVFDLGFRPGNRGNRRRRAIARVLGWSGRALGGSGAEGSSKNRGDDRQEGVENRRSQDREVSSRARSSRSRSRSRERTPRAQFPGQSASATLGGVSRSGSARRLRYFVSDADELGRSAWERHGGRCANDHASRCRSTY